MKKKKEDERKKQRVLGHTKIYRKKFAPQIHNWFELSPHLIEKSIIYRIWERGLYQPNGTPPTYYLHNLHKLRLWKNNFFYLIIHTKHDVKVLIRRK